VRKFVRNAKRGVNGRRIRNDEYEAILIVAFF